MATRLQTANMSTPTNRPTSAFYVQSALSFAVALVAIGTAVVLVPIDPWIRGFLAIGLLYVVTSTFNLAKCIRDRQETETVLSRVDRARLEKLLTEHDPFTSNT
jgi:hypothetical protein